MDTNQNLACVSTGGHAPAQKQMPGPAWTHTIPARPKYSLTYTHLKMENEKRNMHHFGMPKLLHLHRIGNVCISYTHAERKCALSMIHCSLEYGDRHKIL